MFKEYNSKPIVRLAHQITEDDVITKLKEESSYRIDAIEGESVIFQASSRPEVTDFILYANEGDIYHCPYKLFAERNVV